MTERGKRQAPPRAPARAPTRQTAARRQGGGFVIGLIVGLLIGLALALGVALYVTKVPVPFVNKVPQRTAGQDAAEAEKNKNWDPNSPLYGKNPARPGSGADTGAPITGAATAPTTAPATAPLAVPLPPSARASAPASTRDPAAILGDAASAAAPRPPKPVIAGGGADPFTYFVQVGAYGRPEDAEQQRAKLAMMGVEARLTEREQSGRTVYRVRVGPFERRDEADATKSRLDGAGIDAALVRVQR